MKITDRTYTLLLLTPATLFLMAFIAYPLLTLVFNSFHEVTLLSLNDREFIDIDNYIKAFRSPRVRLATSITVQYTALALGVEMLLGFAIALLFNRFRNQASIALTVFLFPLMIPPIVAGLLWRFMLQDQFGILNWMLEWAGVLGNASDIAWLSDPDIVLYSVALPNIWLTTSFVTLIIYTGLQNIPQEILEAAKIDGASGLQTLFGIIIPILRPVIAVALIIRGIDAARTFDMIWIMTEGGPRFRSEVLSMHIYRTMIRNGDLGEASATATLFLIAMLIFSMIAFYSIWRPSSK